MKTILKSLMGTMSALGAVGAAVMLLASASAQAQEYPTRPITIIVPFAPGGNTDILNRIVADRMSPVLGQKIVIVNRPGGGGVVGAMHVARANPDGYTLLGWGASTLTPAFVKNLSIDLMKDFAPVGAIYQGGMVLLGSTANPAMTSLRSIADYAKTNPNKFTMGAGSNLSRAGGKVLQKELGVDAPIILYKSSAEVIAALARGEIDAAVDGTSPVSRSQIAAGKVRNLMVLGDIKNPVYPDMPTAIEMKLPQLVQGACLGIWVPTGTPQAVIVRLNAALNQALKDPGVQDLVKQAGFGISPGTPEEFRRVIASQAAFWSDAAKKAGIEPE